MEKKPYHWLLKLLSGNSTSLKILETILIADSKPSSIHFRDNSYGLGVSFQHTQTILEFFNKMYKEFLWRQKIRNSGSLVCYFISKNERRKIYERDLKDIISGVTTAQVIHYIQPARPNSDIYEVIYNFRIEYTQQGYVSSLNKIFSDKTVKENDPQIFNIVCDFALTILTLVEKSEFKRVMILELEFIEDIDKNIWLAFAKEIQIAKPEVCLTKTIKDPSDLWTIPLKKHPKYILGRNLINFDDSKSLDEEDERYVNKRGHLRNKESNLNIPIKILRPDEFKRSGTPDNNIYSEEIRKEALAKEHSANTPKSERKINHELIQNAKRLEAKKKLALYLELSKYPELRAKLRKKGLYEDYLTPKANSKGIMQKIKSETNIFSDSNNQLTLSPIEHDKLGLKIHKAGFKIASRPYRNTHKNRLKASKKNSSHLLTRVNVSPVPSQLVLGEMKVRKNKKSLTQKIDLDQLPLPNLLDKMKTIGNPFMLAEDAAV
ncbi:unnamed protein product [Blepharisma stoltei]|uniref:Uncharacterized protein n=1 Tax=Blepharisma stoltei TaxID=1481888 RepID=A0AAU9IT39_9CILI|nr:unnamed protein product [Blepharisma stoltei]